MSGNVVAWVFASYPVEGAIDRARKLILSEVAEAANRDFEGAHPGVAKIAQHWGFDPGTVRRHLKSLVADGWLEVTEEGGGRGKATVYRVREERGASRTGFADTNARNLDDKRAQSEPDTRAFRDPSLCTTPDTPLLNTPALAIDAPSLVDRVFSAWCEVAMPSGRARLDKARRRAIEKALREYPIDDVLDAVRGWQHDRWHRERRKNDLGYLLRDSEHIEKFRDLNRSQQQPNEDARRAGQTRKVQL